MGKFNGRYITGVVGPFIYKVVNGETRVSLRPVKGSMKQSPATILSGATFGMAGSIGKAIRNSLIYQTNGLTDYQMCGRLVKALLKVLRGCREKENLIFHFDNDSFKPLVDVEFNINSPVYKYLQVVPSVVVEGLKMTVYVPNYMARSNIRFPSNTFYCKLNITLSFFRLDEGLAIEKPETQLVIIKRFEDFSAEQLSFTLPEGCLCITTVFLQYFNDSSEGGLSYNNKKFNPGTIINTVLTPGDYSGNDGRRWVGMKVIPTQKI